MTKIKDVWDWLGHDKNYNVLTLLVSILGLIFIIKGYFKIIDISISLKQLEVESLLVDDGKEGTAIITLGDEKNPVCLEMRNIADDGWTNVTSKNGDLEYASGQCER